MHGQNNREHEKKILYEWYGLPIMLALELRSAVVAFIAGLEMSQRGSTTLICGTHYCSPTSREKESVGRLMYSGLFCSHRSDAQQCLWLYMIPPPLYLRPRV